MKKIPKPLVTVIACLCCIAVTASVCLLSFRRSGDYSKYEEIQGVIDRYYIGEVDGAAVEDAVSRAFISALGDRWSYYMSAEEYTEYTQYTENRYLGIGAGVETDADTEYPVITDVTADSPAALAGLAVGNSMVALEGEDLKGVTPEELKERMQSYGEKSFTLTVMNDQGATRDAELQCAVVFSDPVRYEMTDDGIGYIKISNFEDGCADSFRAAVNELLKQGAKGFVFDVRNNPGGKVSELISALDRLLPKEELFISRDRDGTETAYSSDPEHVEEPMAVIVNGNSYSAAEYFAAVLQEYRAAVVVGEPTTGKSRSQTTVELSDGSAVHISNNTYLTPAGTDLAEAGGVTPDVLSHPVEDSKLDVQRRAAENALAGA